MQLKKIEKLCKERKSIMVMRDVDDMGQFRTFIGDGVAMYEVQGMEDVIGGDLLLTIFDVKPGDRDAWTINEVDGASKFVANVMPGDREAERVGPTIIYHGKELEAYHSAKTLVWIDAKYWAPLRDERKAGEVRVYMREDVNGIIVKRGMGITERVSRHTHSPTKTISQTACTSFGKRSVQTESGRKEQLYDAWTAF